MISLGFNYNLKSILLIDYQMILPLKFFQRDALEVAPELLGQYLVRKTDSGVEKHIITELEVYRGIEDKACHCHKGRTARTEIMYASGGQIYIYLVYGMHYMLNFVTGEKEMPQAILIRSLEKVKGPGRLTKALAIDKAMNTKRLLPKNDLCVEKNKIKTSFKTTPRIGIDYAAEWKDKPWRFVLK